MPDATDIVINATSIGLFPDVDARLDLDLETLRPGMVVADIIPNPPRTQLIVEAEKRGCKVIDGLGMLVNQGVIGVKYWTGVDVDRSGDAPNHSRPVRSVVARPHLGAALVTTTPMALRVRHRRPKASFRPIEMVPI